MRDSPPVVIENGRAIVGDKALAILSRKSAADQWLEKFITQDVEMLALKRIVSRLAGYEDTVLIHGESGTGKELIARALHGQRKGKFVDVNCGGFPEHLFESEMFGHVKGAFTGAYADKTGLIAQANNGTLFIDEIAELPMFMQTKLLRVIQERVFRRVGGVVNEPFTTRIVAATHARLRDNPRFREDLYWRISTVELEITPLRERLGDVPLILNSMGYTGAALVCSDPVNFLRGNVRELQRIARRYQLARM